MRYSIIPIVLLSIFSLQSCQSDSIQFENKVELVSNGSLTLALDSVTPRFVTSFYHNELKNELSILNLYTNAIYNYDASSGVLKSKDHYEIEGPNGVGKFSSVTEFIRVGDSTIVYDRVLKNLIVANAARERVYIKKFGMTTTESPYGMWGAWIIPKTNGFDLSGSAVNLSFEKVVPPQDSLEFTLNISSGDLSKNYLPIPSEYHGEKWLTEMLRYYRAYNPDSDEAIYSWPITDSIFTKNSTGEMKSYLLSTSNIIKPKALPNNPESILMNPTNKANFLFENGFYSYAYYDPYRKLVLRFAFSGIKKGRINMNALFDNPDDFDMTLIVANDQFEKLAEINVDRFEPNVVFFKKDGIYLLKKSDNEDELTFERFSINPKL